MGQTHTLTTEERPIDRQMPGLGKQHRLVCSCGKRWPWRNTQHEAQADADMHGKAS